MFCGPKYFLLTKCRFTIWLINTERKNLAYKQIIIVVMVNEIELNYLTKCTNAFFPNIVLNYPLTFSYTINTSI